MDGGSRFPAPSRMPPLFNPTHNVLPINLSGNPTVEVHPQATSISRREIGSHSIASQSSNPSVTTNYQIRTDLPMHTNTRERSRVRRSTIDSYGYPLSSSSVLSEQERLAYRPVSPKIYDNVYRSAESGYTSIPDSLRYENQTQPYYHGERDNNQNQFDTDINSQPMHRSNSSRYVEQADHGYEEGEFRYTNPRDMSLYALEQTCDESRPYRLHNSQERKPRPRSIQTYADLLSPNFYDSRDDGPPVSSRGFDKLRLGIRERNQNSLLPVRASSLEPRPEMRYRPQSIDPKKPDRSPHYGGRPRSRSREVFYDTRERRRRRNSLEREEYMERLRMRTERRDRSENDRVSERRRRGESKDSKELRGRDAIAAGLSIAGAALGLTALRNAALDERNFHEGQDGRKRKEHGKEKRHKKSRVDEESSESQSSLDMRDKNLKNNLSSVRSGRISRDDVATSNLNTRGQEERQRMREKRTEYSARRQRQKNRSKVDQSETSSSENESFHSWCRNSREENDPNAGTKYGPNDIVDMTLLKKEMLKIYEKSLKNTSRDASTRNSKDTSSRNDDEARNKGGSESHTSVRSNSRKPRVVSPPRDKVEEKPVKGILRPPRDKFPEDPAPARDDVAQLEDAKRKVIPSDAVWTRVSRRIVNPEALEARKERFEAHDEHILIFRVLTKEEIQYYADLTQEIRIFHEQECNKFEDHLASSSDAPELNFEHPTQDYSNSDYNPEYYHDDTYEYGRTNYFQEAPLSYRRIDYPESQYDFGHTSYPEGQHGHGYISYPEDQYGYDHIDYPTEGQYRTSQNYYDLPISHGSSEPSSNSNSNKILYNDGIYMRDPKWYLREKGGPYMYGGGSRGENNLPSDYPTYRSHENQMPDYHLAGGGSEPYPPDVDPMAWNMMNSGGGWHEFRGP